MFCQKCGNELPEKANYCNDCGTAIFTNSFKIYIDNEPENLYYIVKGIAPLNSLHQLVNQFD